MPLPVILLHNGKLHFFMSSEFEHGNAIVQKGDAYFKLYHNKIYLTNANGDLEFDAENHPKNEHPFDLSITRNVVITSYSIHYTKLYEGK